MLSEQMVCFWYAILESLTLYYSLVNVLVVHVHPVFIFPLSNETGDSTPIGCSTVLVVFTLNGKRIHIS